jgi:hypothetical protein
MRTCPGPIKCVASAGGVAGRAAQPRGPGNAQRRSTFSDVLRCTSRSQVARGTPWAGRSHSDHDDLDPSSASRIRSRDTQGSSDATTNSEHGSQE